MSPESYPGGKSPGAAGAHDAPVLLGYVPEHIGDVGKCRAAIGTTVSAGGVQIKLGLGGE